MEYEGKGLDLVFETNEAIERYTFVSLMPNGRVSQGRGGTIIGVCQNAPSEKGKMARVRVSGVTKLQMTTGTNPGEPVAIAPEIARDTKVYAIALEGDAAHTGVVTVLLRLGG